LYFSAGFSVKKFANKSAHRTSLKKDVDAFLRKGGKVTEVPRGQSAEDKTKPPVKNQSLFQEKQEDRTPLTHLLSQIDARRSQPSGKTKSEKKPRQPRRVTIYDDFGEPLRYEWVYPDDPRNNSSD